MVYVGLSLVIELCRCPMDLFQWSILSHVFLSLSVNSVVDIIFEKKKKNLRVII